jgi:acetoacetyl-CoA reductase
MMMMKTVLIAQADSEIGAALCASFQAAGYRVICIFHPHEDLKELSFLNDLGPLIFKWDLADEQECLRKVDWIEEQYGPVYALINQGGPCNDQPLSSLSVAEFQKAIHIHLTSVFSLCKSVVPLLTQRVNGRIINIGSMVGHCGEKGMIHYAASKAGVVGLSKSLAKELAGFGTTVNVISPGAIRTQQLEATATDVLVQAMRHVPLQRMGIPKEIADLALFLASEKASFITGATFHINGGEWMNE